MKNTNTKSRFFEAMYKICKEQSIDFDNLTPMGQTTQQQRVEQAFIRRNRKEEFKEFLDFYKKKIKEEKPLIILDLNQSAENLSIDKIEVKKQKIYGGFIYLDRKKFLLLNRSYKYIIGQISTQYLESERQKERNITNDNN